MVVVAALGPVDPSGLQACASCAVGANHIADVESQRYMSVPEVPRETRRWIAIRPGDVLEEDAAGNVLAIRHATTPTTWTRLKRRPRAVSPEGVDWVFGEVEQ